MPVSAPIRAARLVAGIQLGGLLAALIFHSIVGWGLGWGFPWNTFLYNPKASYSDFYEILGISPLPRPYDAGLIYPPFCLWVLRPFTWLPRELSFYLFTALGLALLATGLYLLIRRIVPLDRATRWLLLVSLMASYPVIYCVDRGNLDLLAIGCATLALALLHRHLRWATALLAGCIAMKIYPAAFLSLLVARRRLAVTAVVIVAVALLSWACLASFESGISENIAKARSSAARFTEICCIQDGGCIGTATLWNGFKLAYVAEIVHIEGIPPRPSLIRSFVRDTFAWYQTFVLLFALYCGVHTCLVETSHRRCLALLALYATCVGPISMDYKLMLLLPALVVWCGIRRPRPGDQIVLWCLALAIVAKKYYFLPSLPYVNIGVFLNPALQSLAMTLIIWGGWRTVRLRRAVLRLRAIVLGRELRLLFRIRPRIRAGSR